MNIENFECQLKDQSTLKVSFTFKKESALKAFSRDYIEKCIFTSSSPAFKSLPEKTRVKAYKQAKIQIQNALAQDALTEKLGRKPLSLYARVQVLLYVQTEEAGQAIEYSYNTAAPSPSAKSNGVKTPFYIEHREEIFSAGAHSNYDIKRKYYSIVG